MAIAFFGPTNTISRFPRVTGRRHGGQVLATLNLHLQDSKAAFGIVVGEPLDLAGKAARMVGRTAAPRSGAKPAAGFSRLTPNPPAATNSQREMLVVRHVLERTSREVLFLRRGLLLQEPAQSARRCPDGPIGPIVRGR